MLISLYFLRMIEWLRMTDYCPKCGKGLPDDAAFCDRCGQKIGVPVAPSNRWEVRKDRMERRWERWGNRGPDYLNGVGFGVFLIAVAWVYLQYPWVWGATMSWLRSWVNGPTTLPLLLAGPIALFLTVMGGWGLVEGALRMVSGRISRGVVNIIGGIGGLAIAYMMQLYGQGSISSRDLLPYFIIIFGATVILSAVVGIFTWESRRD
jgi:hypothetical protein